MIFTIGTSDRTLAGFRNELEKRKIRHLVDVRSSPRSRLAHFNRSQMEQWCERSGIFYRWAGDVLGGMSESEVGDELYTVALSLIIQAGTREPLAIFCAEGDPRECHRSYEVAAALLVGFGVEAVNIRRDGSDEVITRTLAFTKPALIPECIRQEIAERLISPQPDLPL
ncbi:MAG: DUF488 family protein [Brevundimonas aurantiaca]|uniref:DUF488 family protein n=1 Tax=Brevundimonas aurantiaca TaxID=74316 RepID=UPI00391DA1AA